MKKEQFYATLDGLINSSEYKTFNGIEKNLSVEDQDIDLSFINRNDNFYDETKDNDLSYHEIYLINYENVSFDADKVIRKLLKEYHEVTYLNIPEEHHFLALGELYRYFIGYYDPDSYGELLKKCNASTVIREGYAP